MTTTTGLSSCRLLLAVALLLLCAAATTTQGQGEPIKPRTKFISYAAPPGPNPECMRARVPPFCRGKSAITARRSPAGEPAPVVRRTPAAPAELEAMAAAAADAPAGLAAGPLCFVYSDGRRLCVPTQ